MGRKRDIPYKTIGINQVIRWRHHLPKSYLERGMSYEKQPGSWDCGPNSSARALYMWAKNTRDFSDYDDFRSRCPKTLGTPNTQSGIVWGAIGHFLTLGLSTIITAKLPDVGPTPSALADYVSEKLGIDGNAYHYEYDTIDAVLNAIKNDIDIGDPVIALLSRSSIDMHYINIVAVSDQDDVAYIDTDNSLEYYTRDEFRYLLNCSNYDYYSCSLGVYNIIRFQSNEFSKEDFFRHKKRYGESVPIPLSNYVFDSDYDSDSDSDSDYVSDVTCRCQVF